MNKIIFVFVLAILIYCENCNTLEFDDLDFDILTLPTGKIQYNLEKTPLYFERFVARYNKQYNNDEEKNYRYNIFKHNIETINKKNSQNDSAVYKINRFADLTKSEVITKHTGLAARDQFQNFCETMVVNGPPIKNRPTSFDWRDYNKVSSVKDQGDCGSCWAFASLSSIESQYAIKYDQHIDLSEQQLVDCDHVDNGCNGGLLHTAFEEILKMGGVEREIDYSYRGSKTDCTLDPQKFAVSIHSCFRYVLLNEIRLEDLLRTVGPIAIAVDAIDLVDYYGGVIGHCNNYGLNHAMLLVGYGVENNTPFWTFKNSWGVDYGEQGYVRVRRGVNSCGMINELAASATIM